MTSVKEMSMAIRPADLYHVGMVVDDLDGMLQLLTAAAGYRWIVQVKNELPVCFAHSTQRLDMRAAFSLDQPHLEVIQHVPGTLWAPSANGGLHHIGYWSDDIAADSAELVAAGFPIEASGQDAEGHLEWTFHFAGVGPNIELINSSFKAAVDDLIVREGVPSPT
jgi:hypothetical protein